MGHCKFVMLLGHCTQEAEAPLEVLSYCVLGVCTMGPLVKEGTSFDKCDSYEMPLWRWPAPLDQAQEGGGAERFP